MKNKILFAALALAVSVAARADSVSAYVKFETSVGVSRYNHIGDGTWVQYGMPHTISNRAVEFSVGLTGPLYATEQWGIDWHVDYVNLGHTTASCDCTSADADYDPVRHALRNPQASRSRFVGEGGVQGFALTIEPHYTYGGFRFGAEGGLYVFRQDWNEIVDNTTFISRYSAPHTTMLGKVAGVTIGRGPFRLGYKHYWLPTRYDAAHVPSNWTSADVIEVKFVGNIF